MTSFSSREWRQCRVSVTGVGGIFSLFRNFSSFLLSLVAKCLLFAFFLLFPLSDLGANFETKEQPPCTWGMDSYIILPTRRYYSNVKLLQYFSTGGKKYLVRRCRQAQLGGHARRGVPFYSTSTHGHHFFVKVANKFFSCVHGSKMLPGEVVFFGCHSMGEGGVKGEKEIVKNSIKMKPAFYNFDVTFCCGKLHNFSIAKK